jgi:hypothetical protein
LQEKAVFADQSSGVGASPFCTNENGGSQRAEAHTMSQNMMVSWRRSAEDLGVVDAGRGGRITDRDVSDVSPTTSSARANGTVSPP